MQPNDCDRCKNARIIKRIWRCKYFSTLTGQGRPCSRVKYEECRFAFRRVIGSTPAEIREYFVEVRK